MKKSILIALCATSMGFAAIASAADGVAIVDQIDGSVLVNQGESFVPAVEGQSLNSGDRVMVTKSGSATLVFGKDCTREVRGGTMVTIPAESVCEGGQLVSQNLEPGMGNAPGTNSANTAKSGTGVGATGNGNAGIYTLAAITLAIAAYEIQQSP